MNKRREFERRGGERLPLSIVVFVRGNDEEGTEFVDLATVINLSTTGALVRVQRYAGPNMEVSIEFPGPGVAVCEGVARPTAKAGWVVRSASSRRGELWGIRFESPFAAPPEREMAPIHLPNR